MFSLLVATLAPTGVIVAATYVTSLMQELEYYSLFSYLLYYVILLICVIAIQMLFIGTARIAVKVYNGEKTDARDVLYAFNGKAVWKHLLCSVAMCALTALFVGVFAVTFDALDTVQKAVELNGLSGGSLWVIKLLAAFAVGVILFPIFVRFAPVPFLMALHPEESLASIVRTSLAITRVSFGEAVALSRGLLLELFASALLLFVPWVVAFGPSRAVSLAGFAVEALNALKLPDTDLGILPNGADGDTVSLQDN